MGTGAGFDMYPLRVSATPWFASGVAIRKTGGTYKLASTQGYQTMDTPTGARPQVRTASLEEYRKEPDFAKEEQPPAELTLYKPYPYAAEALRLGHDDRPERLRGLQRLRRRLPVGEQHRGGGQGAESCWAGTCTGCAWTPTTRAIATIPRPTSSRVPCMQCENAPCELVCPVGATVHSPEGLNDMVYNRCVGTRYCSNNCPYKVRRFNFLLFQDWETPQYKMMRNPDVTVRSRGVMEKCTYCVQRINEHRDRRRARRPQDSGRRDADRVPAGLPGQGHRFRQHQRSRTAGSSKLKAQPRNYGLLADLNTRPRTTYLADIRNPNPELESESTA